MTGTILETLSLAREAFTGTILDVAPIAIVLAVFQLFVLRQPIANLGRVMAGVV